jgi:hypothetical protein
VRLSTLGKATKLTNLVTGEGVTGKLPPPPGWNRQNETTEARVSFAVHLPPHSYAVFTTDKTTAPASAQ